MTDEEYILSKSQDYGRSFCPGCDPDLDPLTGVRVVCYCREHEPGLSGAQDSVAYTSSIPLIGGDMDAHANRLWCDLLHRGKEST